MIPTTNIPVQKSRSQSFGCLQLILFAITWMWVSILTLGRLVSQLFASATINIIPDAAWVVLPLIQGLALTLPLLLMAYFWRKTPWQSILRTWLAASIYVLLLAPVSLIDPTAMQAHALLTIMLSLVYLALLYTFTMRFTPPGEGLYHSSPGDLNEPASSPGSTGAHPGYRSLIWGLVLAGIPLLALPWLAWGALGSALDTILMVLAGLALGWVIAVTVDRLLIPGLRTAGYGSVGSFLLGGFAAGTAILIFASGLGFALGGIQLLLAVCLPPLGWLAHGFWELYGTRNMPTGAQAGKLAPIFSSAKLPAAVLIGLAAAFPLALIDPDELALIVSLASGEILVWAFAAAGISAAIALLLSVLFLAFFIISRRHSDRVIGSNRWILAGTAALIWSAAVYFYLVVGQPGFHGEELFIVLKNQADLSASAQFQDPFEQRQYVYETLVAHANTTQVDLRRQLELFHIEYTPYYLVNGIRLSAGGPLVSMFLSTWDEVDQVLTIPSLRPLPQALPVKAGNHPQPVQPDWNLTMIHADQAWEDFDVRGDGIIIGQSDSGVQWDHPELLDSYRGSDGHHDYTWFDPWYGTRQPTDAGGHGTHTLGIVLGNHTGVAPDAQWIACANLARNLGNPGFYLDCMQFMLAPFPIGGDPFTDGDPARGANVLNNSWGCPEYEGCSPDVLQPAADALTAAGIFVVASAGNDGPFCSSLNMPIAIYDSVISVAAADSTENWAYFSSVGRADDGSQPVKPDIMAPGVMVVSSLPGNSYGQESGTSMAGPHVAGVVALMWSANPRLIGDIDLTSQILQATAQQPYTGTLPNCQGAADLPSTAIGYGMVDAYAAVEAALQDP